MGYQGSDLIDYFDVCEDNYICSMTKRPISPKIILIALYLIIKTFILKPNLFFLSFRWCHTIYFIAAYLKIKKISYLISFTDYNILPFFLKKILDSKIKTIGIQNSRRENNAKYFNFDFYFSLSPLGKDKFNFPKKSILNNFGSLRLILSINSKNKWQQILELPNVNKSPVELILISSAAPDFLKYAIKLFKPNSSKRNYKSKILELLNIYNKDKNKYFRELRFLNFILLCDYISDYAKKRGDKIFTINRTDIKSLYYKDEKFFFNKFKGLNLKKLDKKSKYDFLLSKKSAIVISDISTLSRECLSINMKCLFFNNFINYTNKTWYNNKAIFYSNSEDREKLYFRLDKIKLMNKVKFYNEKKKINKAGNVFTPKKNNLRQFLNMTGLKLK